MKIIDEHTTIKKAPVCTTPADITHGTFLGWVIRLKGREARRAILANYEQLEGVRTMKILGHTFRFGRQSKLNFILTFPVWFLVITLGIITYDAIGIVGEVVILVGTVWWTWGWLRYSKPLV